MWRILFDFGPQNSGSAPGTHSTNENSSSNNRLQCRSCHLLPFRRQHHHHHSFPRSSRLSSRLRTGWQEACRTLSAFTIHTALWIRLCCRRSSRDSDPVPCPPSQSTLPCGFGSLLPPSQRRLAAAGTRALCRALTRSVRTGDQDPPRPIRRSLLYAKGEAGPCSESKVAANQRVLVQAGLRAPSRSEPVPRERVIRCEGGA